MSDGCSREAFAGLGRGDVPVASRGDCLFHDKAANAQRAGAGALVILDYPQTRRGLPSATLGRPDIRIPVVLVSFDGFQGSGPGSAVRVRVEAVSRPSRIIRQL